MTQDTFVNRVVKGNLRAHPEYAIWAAMIQRCTNPNHKQWRRYGGRGIAVCSQWRNFENFFGDMGPRPSSGHSLDRIDNDGDYEPDNCRWATRVEQASNTARNRRVTLAGEVVTLAEAARRTGINCNTIYSRHWSGKPMEKVLSTAPLPRGSAPDPNSLRSKRKAGVL